MKLEKFRAKGFIGFKRGLGLDEVSVDFTGHDGLVALSGQNGTSKSTLLELLSPFNVLASRGGALFNHTFLRNSEKELSFTYNGHSYRTLLKIDHQSGKSEGFIWRDGESLVNGKIRDYSKKIVEIFGSENLFFNSVFCSQNAAKLSDMTTGELKNLFAEFLRLDRLQAFEESCKQNINILSGKAAQIDTSLEVLHKRMEGMQENKAELARLNTLKTEQEGLKTDLNAKLLEAQKERERLKEVIARNEVFERQIEEMKATLTGMEKNRDQEGKEVEEKLNKLRTQYQELSREIAEADKVLASEAAIFAAVENEKACKELIDSLTEAIELRVTAMASEQGLIHSWEQEIAELNNSLPTPSKDERIVSINGEIRTIEQRLEGYKSQLKALELRDPECTSKSCSFITAALKAESEIPGAQDRLSQLKIEKENRITELSAIGVEMLQQRTAKEELLKASRARLIEQQNIQTSKRKELATARAELTQFQNLAAKQSEIAVAKSKREDRVKALEVNKNEGMSVSGAWKAKKLALDERIGDQQNKISAIEDQVNADAAGFLYGIEDKIQKFNKSTILVDQEISGVDKNIAKYQGELAGINEAEAQLQKATGDQTRVMADIADWTYIRNACGKNGLQAMEIDGAAPLITNYANDLLSKAFGSLYTIKFRTQDEDGKECLDIIVITEDGEEVLLDNLSGGQKVWSLMALRLAMTLLSKEKSGRNFEAFFADEIDGPLDSENAGNFVRMYQAFMKIGGFKSGYFISHKESCRDLADNILMFEPGKSPYFQ